MNAKDIGNKRFEKIKLGYTPEDVDYFLKNVANDYEQIQREKEELEAKIQILADKVREYRSDEDALKDALLGAQKEAHRVINTANDKANAIIADAQSRADAILEKANRKSDEMVGQIRLQAEHEREVLAETQKAVSEFKRNLFEMYKSHLEMISSMPESDDEDFEEYEEYEEENEEIEIPVSKAASEKETEVDITNVLKTSIARTSEKPMVCTNTVNPTKTLNPDNLMFGQQNKH